MMNERPILFRPEMVAAIFEGRKTQTRRVVTPQPCNPSTFGISPIWGSGTKDGHFLICAATNEQGARVDRFIRCPYGQVGDRLWVREKWKVTAASAGYKMRENSLIEIAYDNNGVAGFRIYPCLDRYRYVESVEARARLGKARPSIYMPRWAARLALKITGIRVERLREIEEQDAEAEGLNSCADYSARDRFALLWDTINGAKTGRAWTDNPFVWVVEFVPLPSEGGSVK